MNEFKELDVEAAKELLPVDEAIADREAQVKQWREEIRWLKAHRFMLKDLPKPTFCAGQVDFDNLTHEQVLRVVKTIGGKWKKEAAGADTVHYVGQTEINGRRVRCYNGKPPPSCKIIEVEEHVPAQVIPATVRKVRKLVCHPEVGAIIATAAEKGTADSQASPVG